MPDYKFIVLDNHGKRANRAARSHAMRTALQLRSEGPQSASSSPYNTSALTTKLQAELKGRFRLPVANENTDGHTRGGYEKEVEEEGEQEEVGSSDPMVIDGPSMPQDSSSVTVWTGTPINAFANHPVDPFNTIPVPYNGTVDLLTKYCKLPSQKNSCVPE